MQASEAVVAAVLACLLTAGSCSSAALPGLQPDSIGTAFNRRHEHSHEVAALPGYDGPMPSPQFAGYITGSSTALFFHPSCTDALLCRPRRP